MKNVENPLVSVIMPAYNAEKFIAESIESVLNQTVREIELLVIDDCSADKTCYIVDEYVRKDSRVKLFRNEVNLRVARTRNRGLELCKGDYVAFLDSDDIWYPNKLEAQISLAEKEKADIVYCSYAMVNEEGDKVCADFIVPETTNYEQMLGKNVIGCSTVLLNGETARQNRFLQGCFHEDFALWLNLLKDGKKAVGVSAVLTKYRVYSDSKSYNKRRSAQHRWKIYREVIGLSRRESVCYFGKYALNGILKYRGMGQR